MREILFRGKQIDNGEWVEGYYAAEPYTKNTYNYGYILENEKDLYAKKAYLVDSRTVGQFTGLTDKNGKKIFEGDIVDCLDYLGEVYYDPDGCYDLRDNTGEMRGDFIGTCHSREVIGNIHDNPDLLGGDDN